MHRYLPAVGMLCLVAVSATALATGYGNSEFGDDAVGGITQETINALCADQGALVYKVLTYVGGTMVGASALANFKSIHEKYPWIGFVLRIVGVKWASWISEAAKEASQEKGTKS